MLRVANFQMERLGLPLIVLNDKADAASVHIATRHCSRDTVLLDITADNPRRYFRLLWELHGTKRFLKNCDLVGPAELSLHLPNWERHSSIAWIALLQGPNEESLRFFKKIPQSKIEKAELDSRVLLDCPRLKNENRLFLAFHFEAVSCKVTVGIPFLTWPRSARPNVGVLATHISDYTLTVTGWARDARFPGLPVRVGLWIDGRKAAEALAASPVMSVDPEYPLPPGAMHYSVKLPVRESDLLGVAAIGVDGSGETDVFHLADLGPENTAGSAERARPPSAMDTVIGKVETVSRTVISGWALCEEDVEAPVGLVLFVGEQAFAYAECDKFRSDVKAIYQGHGFYGFSFELPPGVLSQRKTPCTISPIAGVSKIKQSSFFLDPVGKLFEPSTAEVDRLYQPAPSIRPTVAPVSAVVLNRNGAAVLDELLRSAAAVEDVSMIEWIIVDHNSTDESEAVCRMAVRRGQCVRFEKREGNFSFSESNNYGAQIASKDILIFLNNDVVLRVPFVTRVRGYLADERIGAVGISLVDYIPSEVPGMAPPHQHLGVYFLSECRAGWIRPFEARLSDETRTHPGKPVEVPMISGAFLAMRKSDFFAVGGFDEEYYYGLEDLDLCLKIRARILKHVVCANEVSAIHHRGFSRNHDNTATIRWSRNNNRFSRVWACSIRWIVKKELLLRPGFWTGVRPVVAFIIPSLRDSVCNDEYYMACELGRAIQRLLPVHLRYITEAEWYDLSNVDLLVVLADAFTLSKVRVASPFLVTARWTAARFDRRAEDLSMHGYDHVFAASQRAANYLGERMHRPVSVLPAASNSESVAAGTRRAEFSCDYCFIGDRSDIPHAIEFELDPARIDGEGAVFGQNWQGTALGAIARAAVPRSRLPDLLASTRIVIDLTDPATAPWGGWTGRVFDALAAGCLLVTNDVVEARELFGDLMPTFNDRESLASTLNYWLKHEDKRAERVRLLQELLRKCHTYDHRAHQFVGQISNADPPVKIAIKCAATHAQRDQWEDYHFAESLAGALRAEGYLVRVDCRENWDRGISNSDDFVLVLRGMFPYRPKAHQKNIMWLMSHPAGISTEELDSYDYLYVASLLHSDILSMETETPVEFLPTCTDVRLFSLDHEVVGTRPDRAVFVGNARGVLTDGMRWCLEQNLDVKIYGTGWQPFVKGGQLMGQLIPNEVRAGVYASSRIVMLDHCADMKRLGYVSSQVFDVLCAGGIVAVDGVPGLGDLVPGGCYIYSNANELTQIIEAERRADLDERMRVSSVIGREHSFEVRARTISSLIQRMIDRRFP